MLNSSFSVIKTEKIHFLKKKAVKYIAPFGNYSYLCNVNIKQLRSTEHRGGGNTLNSAKEIMKTLNFAKQVLVENYNRSESEMTLKEYIEREFSNNPESFQFLFSAEELSAEELKEKVNELINSL